MGIIFDAGIKCKIVKSYMRCCTYSVDTVINRKNRGYMSKFNRNKMMKSLVRVGACAVVGLLSASSCEKESVDINVARDLVLTSEEQQLVEKGNAFAFEWFKQITSTLESHDNTMVSPISLSTVLAMTANGAHGETKEEIYGVVGLEGLEERVINDYYQKLITGLPLVDPTATLDIANSIWYRRGFSVLPTFLDVNREYYKAAVEALDFADPAAPGRINSWVDQHTHGKIPSIVENIPANMVMYLINAVYFKGVWQQQFDPENTSTGIFHLANEDSLQTDFMRLESSFSLQNSELADAIELAYGDGQYSMVVIKPKDGYTPTDVVDQLGKANVWKQWMGGLRASKVNLHLPKFKFSYDRTLNDDLMTRGMGLAFSEHADFSRINSEEDLLISEVKQKTFVEVNEEGTEAAAVTSVGVGVTSMPMITQFVVNSPFLFVIREVQTGLILFIGQVNDPSTEETKG